MSKNLEVLLTQYKPSEEARDIVSSVKSLFIVGISGAGKDTIQRILIETDKYHQIVSHTTRSPRKNHGVLEKNGKEYFFISLEQAERMLADKEFVEAKYYSGHIYGTSVKEFVLARKEKKMVIADIEIQGVAEYKELTPDQIYPVFLLPPSYSVWQQRWEKRYGNEAVDDEAKKLRMQTAIAEIEHVLHTSYYAIVVNDVIEQTIKEVSLIAKSGFQSDDEYIVGRRTAEEILTAMKQQVSTL